MAQSRAERSVPLWLDAPFNGWEELKLQDFEVRYIPGNHFNLFVDIYTSTLASVLKSCLDEAYEEL
jgi:surfactin synthase thioesterase subunit